MLETISRGASWPFTVTWTPAKLVGAGVDAADWIPCEVKSEPDSVANPPGLQESPAEPFAVLDIVKAPSGALLSEALLPDFVALKVTPVTFPPFTVTEAVAGEKVYPVSLGVTVYVPFAIAVRVKFPELSAVVLMPLFIVNVAPTPNFAGWILPEMLHVDCCAVAVKVTPVTFPPFTVTDLLVGENVYPGLLAVTVYVPFATPLNVKFPELSAVTLASLAPVKVIVAPLPATDTPPERVH